MSRPFISKALRERVTSEAGFRCGYCLVSVALTGMPMEMDHIIPKAIGGATALENLWLVCSLCNDHKGQRISAPDPQTGEITRLFDPRRQRWADQFEWRDEGILVAGKTPCGRATVAALRLNRAERLEVRRAWVAVGWHPPKI